MAIEVKDFDVMVDDVLQRIASSTGISNTGPGSVIRTIVEAIMAEQDIQYYQISQIFDGMDVDIATGDDLSSLVKILGIIRKSATKCSANITFGISSPSATDIIIPFGSTVSTRADADGEVIEFTVDNNAVITAGQLTASVACTAKVAGLIYVPVNSVVVMNSPILNVEYVNNTASISGGTDAEDDDSLRARAKDALSLLGKGTADSIESAVKGIDGVQDAILMDVTRGVGTADIIVVTADMPAPAELQQVIESTVNEYKAAGVDVGIILPNIVTIDISVNTTGFTDASVIGGGILNYLKSLTVGSSLIVNQMERYILNACDTISMDVTTVTPSNNVSVTSTQIIRHGTITINGVVWNG